AAAATHAATKFDIDAARTNAHHKDADVKKQKDKKLDIHKGGNKKGGKGGKGGNFGFDRRSLVGEGFGSDFGAVGKGAFGDFNNFGVGVGSGKGVDLGFNDFGVGSGKGGDFGFNTFGGRKFGSGGGLFYRRSGALFGDDKGGGYDKNLKKHKQVYKHLDKANKNKEAAHIDSAAEFDAAAAQKAAHKAKAEAKAEAKHKLKKGSGKDGDFI
ncbi:hypothetical protein OC842_006496, partial [Tilletia horrida]